MKNTFTKISAILIMIFLLNFIAGCVSDVCPSPVLFYLKNVNIQSFDNVEDYAGTHSSVYTDTIRHQIAFEVRPVIELAMNESKGLNLGLMNVAYGACIEGGIALNPPVIEKSKMYADKPFFWRGGTIDANTNLLEHPEFKDFVNFPNVLRYEGADMITIDVIPMKFLNETYTFTFEWETSDGIILSDAVQVVIRL